MKKNLYAVVDSLAGFVLGIDYSASEPDRYLVEQQRLYLMQPNPAAADAEFRHLGVIDDETLQGELFAIPVKIGDLKPAVLKLEAIKNAREREKAEAAV